MRDIRTFVSAALACIACGGSHAFAGPASTIAFEIPKQELGSAIMQWSRESGLQVIMRERPARKADLVSTGVSGTFTPLEALKLLLSDTRMSFESVNEHTVRIVPSQEGTGARTVSGGTVHLAQADGPLSSASAPQSEPPSELQEITVTATRQAESISRVAVSVTAVTPQAIEQKGLKNLADITRFTPGISFTPDGSRISIRGISSMAGSGTTGIYLDDTPVQMRSLGFNSEDSLPGIFDLERVEILRGPQGTLFGAGSEGGTVRYITPAPSLHTYSGTTRAEISSTRYGDMSYEGGAAFGGPLVENELGFRVSAWYRRNGGYIDRLDTNTDTITERNANHSETAAFRAALSYAPAEGLTITPSVLYQRRGQHDTDAYFTAISDPSAGRFLNDSPELRPDSDKFFLSALSIRYDVGSVSVISNTSYFHRDDYTGYQGALYDLGYYQSLLLKSSCTDGTYSCRSDLYPLVTRTSVSPAVGSYRSPSLVTNIQRNVTEELRVQSNDPSLRLSWVTGIFLQRNRQHSSDEDIDPQGDQLFNLLFNGLSMRDYFGWPNYQNGAHIDSFIADTEAVDKQFAVFADVTYKLTDQWKLNVGGRFASTSYSYVNFTDGSQTYGRTQASGSTSEHPFTPKASISYQLDDANLFYVTYAKGFRAGGASAPVSYGACQADLQQLGYSQSPSSYKSDSVESWEVGAKSRLLDQKLEISTSLYKINWRSIQQTVYLNSCGMQFTGNLGDATSRGFDVQVQYRPIRSLTIDGTLGYTNAYYTKDFAPVVRRGDAIDFDVRPWTFAVGAQQTLPLFHDRAYARIDYEYRSSLNRLVAVRDPADQSYDPEAVDPPSTSFLSIRTGVALDHANISLFVDNLLNSLPQLSYLRASNSTNAELFDSTTFRPRTIGLTATYSW